MLYLATGYRPSCSDTCRGCLMGSSDSEFDQIVLWSKEELKAWVEGIATIQYRDRNHREYANWEIRVDIINPVGIDRGVDVDDEWSCYDDIQVGIANEARQMFQKKYNALEEEERQIELKKKQDEKRRKEALKKQKTERERTELKRLIDKYGIPE